jgi:hypothetical protein
MSNSLQVLVDNRDALLLAEVAAWLHMFGKLQEDFLNGKYHLDREIPKAVPLHFPQLDALLKDAWFGGVWKLLPLGGTGTEKLTPAQLIRTHREDMSKYTEGLRKLLIDAHGLGSGIEKGMLLDRFASPHKNPVYLATSLGYERPIKPTDIHTAQQGLYRFLEIQLNYLKAKIASFDFSEWVDVRNKLIQVIQQSYGITVAETRRPLNDVTLLDQTAISVALFKAALAQNLLLGKWKDPNQAKVADKYHWRLLRVGLDGPTFWGNSTRVGDLLARKGCFEEGLGKIQGLLEVIYPLGSEIYRDENGSIFIVPNIDNLLTYTDGTQSLERHIQDIANQKFAGETDFTLSLSCSTRDTLVFGRLASVALPQPTPRPSWLKQQWQNKTSDICSVCGLRPQGPSDKALRRKVCDTCQVRRVNRSRQWINNPSTTIWIDEVADANGQVVLLVAHFDLTDWLSGNSFNTVLSFDPESRLLSDKEQKPLKPQDYYFDLGTLTNNIQDGLIPGHKFEDDLLGYLVQDTQRGGSDIVQEFYDLHIAETDLGVFSPSPKPELLALSMIRQFPSFARISRVWETTKKFWEEMESISYTTVSTVNTRLKIQGVFLRDTLSQDTLGVSHTYQIRSGNTSLSVTCIKEQEFFTVDNLHRIAVLLGAPEEFQRNYDIAAQYVRNRLLQSESVQIEEPTGYGSPNRPLGSLRIEDVTLEESSYLPAISILTEPRTFMALVPADKALQVAKAIKEKYEKEMGKVRNRLPLTLGVVFAGTRTPLPAILDAGRRTLKQPTEATHWHVKGVDLRLYPEKVLLTLGPGEGGEPSLTLDIPTIMGDEETEDVWYPYWCLEEEAANASERKRKFKGTDGKYWTHISDLQVGDAVSFMPSRFDFEYLDTAARRFEISYDNGKRRGTQQPGSSYHPARPYYLEQLDEFDQLWHILSQGLETTQIRTLIGIIEDKRMEWSADQNNEVFKQTVRDALNNANWKSYLKPEQFNQLYRAALSGQLTDVVELYMRILNQRPEADKSQTEIAKTGGNS